jgi:hypothetical protein
MRRSVIFYLLVGGAIGCFVLVLITLYYGRGYANRANLESVSEKSRQFRLAEIKALSGSVEETDDLIEFYSGCHRKSGYTPARHQECITRFEYWMRIGLENGSPVAQQRQTSSILQSNSCYDAYRAEYLLRQFSRTFRSNVGFLKSVSEEIAEKKKACVWQLMEKSGR